MDSSNDQGPVCEVAPLALLLFIFIFSYGQNEPRNQWNLVLDSQKPGSLATGEVKMEPGICSVILLPHHGTWEDGSVMYAQ